MCFGIKTARNCCMRTLTIVTILLSFFPVQLQASTEIIGAYDGRSAAMAGTGGAFIDSGAAVFHNPAMLTRVDQLAATFDLSPIMARFTVPLNGPQTEVTSDADVFPLFLFGAGWRLSERIVLGFAAYPTAGYGSGYSNVASLGGRDFRLGVFSTEAAPTIAIRLSEKLSAGLAYRVTYAMQTASTPLPATGSAAEVDLSGTNFFGVHVGATYQLSDNLNLALTYRSQVTTRLTGTTTIANNTFDTTSEFSSPHAAKLAAAFWMNERRLMLAFDAEYLFFRTSSKQVRTELVSPGGAGTQTTITPLNWTNVASIGLGAEYLLRPQFPVRAGYYISGSATPTTTAGYFTPPPGLSHSFHFGVGFLRRGRWDFDVAGLYAITGKDAQPNQPTPPPNAGNYSGRTALLSLSATYRY